MMAPENQLNNNIYVVSTCIFEIYVKQVTFGKDTLGKVKLG
jgi:hypothetical protein